LFAPCSTLDTFINNGELSDALKYFHEALEVQQQKLLSRQTDNAAMAQTLNHWQCILCSGNAKEMVVAFSDSMRYLRLAGKKDEDLAISGFAFTDIQNATRVHQSRNSSLLTNVNKQIRITNTIYHLVVLFPVVRIVRLYVRTGDS
jgi:hypothetical protein